MGEVAVFVETNLGTRIAMTVSLDITSADFKRKLEETHESCLPSLGEIRVHGLMVHRKAQFYYLAQSVPIKYIFRDNQKPWFIHAEARLVNSSQEPSISNRFGKSQIRHCSGPEKSPEVGVGLIHGVNKKRKKREFVVSETIVRSSLSTARAAELNNLECFVPKTPERDTSVSKSETISHKLIVAAKNIRMHGKSSMSCSLSSSIFRSKTRRKRCKDGKKLASLAKFMVFEIPDTED
ncbi:unnamed protein product [Eruca vesicaria subsp. sativa]|uniref:Uncharacterized protein n=1 Tax=Eruca vesicaria subsp. sativa TaxID=29727 RepID=A0ABC8KVJ9_ERUVS|nr:unnamed protein product [Eruca vesicaria subsp. sativa]